ncbi:uncharacterized protein CC84DRAFT_185325 [Paraphaeosphaeria sporulosa]|uniref:Uncharacterized protein n=1 Tax=Paraphaeosphaeria sporulosa TaxID=1460663 RepID=A0A177D152_9PLEO|nr:uncharacterized protein CC84DRAFT_185325 [Paraphaeosphaeria sporulosa]OAG13191.1 hypothetical protein CC84DRAFT_185325 [Paraphaeosphaeria sporulosa]
MVKEKKRRKESLAANLPMSSSKRPRFDKRGRQLSRFYEPLVLLYTLGRTRGEHMRDILCDGTNISNLPHKYLIRRFLCSLAYVCDYDKGGDTVTAIGLESRPHGYIFWIASNSNQTTKTVPFLMWLLGHMYQVSIEATAIVPEQVDDLGAKCIDFAVPRIKAYRNHLKPVLRRCLGHLDNQSHNGNEAHGLSEWLQNWNDQRGSEELCHFSYQERKSEFMQLLAKLGTEPSYKSNKDAIHHAFSSARHLIGRLGHHFRVANELLFCASRLSDILHGFEVRSIPIHTRSAIPPSDGKTTLDSVISRMLPSQSADVERYQSNLAEMDAKYQLSRRFLDNYRDPDLNPRVHAEIQVLEHFYVGGLRFVESDAFVACSKPACFCCLLYFRAHPGHFVEPTSHQKIYLNWRPPDLDAQMAIIRENHQRDILNAMTKSIRKEAFRQINEKIPPHARHPESLTGITESASSPSTLELVSITCISSSSASFHRP